MPVSWSALFDSTHIVKGVPVDADIELQCKLCRTYFYTANAYYIGYSDLNYLKPEDEGKCGHNLKELRPTGKWFVRRDIHKRAQDGGWVSLFDYSHIVEGIPVDGDIELECRIISGHNENFTYKTRVAYLYKSAFAEMMMWKT